MKLLSEEVKWCRWKMIGHIQRQDHHNHCNIALTWPPESERRKGRPKIILRRTVKKERKEMGWKSWTEVQTKAADREKWKHSLKALCATRHEVGR